MSGTNRGGPGGAIRNVISRQMNLSNFNPSQGFRPRGMQAYTSEFMRGNPYRSDAFQMPSFQPPVFRPSFQLPVFRPSFQLQITPPTTPVQPDAVQASLAGKVAQQYGPNYTGMTEYGYFLNGQPHNPGGYF